MRNLKHFCLQCLEILNVSNQDLVGQLTASLSKISKIISLAKLQCELPVMWNMVTAILKLEDRAFLRVHTQDIILQLLKIR